MEMKATARQPNKTQLGWSLVVLVWLPMLALLIWGKGGIVDLMALHKQVRQLQAEVEQLRKDNGRLREEIRRLQTDPSIYEAVARERLFLKKPGEIVVYLPPAQDGQPPSAQNQTANQPPSAAASAP